MTLFTRSTYIFRMSLNKKLTVTRLSHSIADVSMRKLNRMIFMFIEIAKLGVRKFMIFERIYINTKDFLFIPIFTFELRATVASVTLTKLHNIDCFGRVTLFRSVFIGKLAWVR